MEFLLKLYFVSFHRTGNVAILFEDDNYVCHKLACDGKEKKERELLDQCQHNAEKKKDERKEFFSKWMMKDEALHRDEENEPLFPWRRRCAGNFLKFTIEECVSCDSVVLVPGVPATVLGGWQPILRESNSRRKFCRFRQMRSIAPSTGAGG